MKKRNKRKLGLALIWMTLGLLIVSNIGVVFAGSGTAETITQGGYYAEDADAVATISTSAMGDGSWKATPGDDSNNDGSDKFLIYTYWSSGWKNNLGTFTVDDIKSISYHTNKPGSENDEDFYLLIYTEPDGNDDQASWYGYRLNAEPYFSNNLNAPSNQWNEWNTNGGTNQLTFFDSAKLNGAYGFYGQPDLQDIQGGTINWHDYDTAYVDQDIDYGAETVKGIALSTGSGWSGTFDGYIDAFKITLTDGTSLTFDFENEVWVDDDFDATTSGWGKDHFDSVQDGIDAVASDGTVHVAAGTYAENINVNKKGLTLQGADAATTILEGTANINADNITFDSFTVSPDTVFTGIPAAGILIGDASHIKVTNNIITGIRGDGSVSIHAIQVFEESSPYITDITISNNEIKDIDNAGGSTWPNYHGAVGIKIQNWVDGVDILDNEISNIHSKGWTYGIVSTPSSQNSTTPTDILLKGNDISGINDGSVYDVWADPNAAPYPGVGFAIDGTAHADEAILRNNSFHDLPIGALNKDGNRILDAENNWWGDNSGPEDTNGTKEVLEDYACSEVTVAEMKNANGLGAGVSDNVDYCPWTTQETQDDGDGGEDGGKVSRKCMADNSGGVCRKSVVKVTVFENTVPDGSQIRIQEKSGANFQLGDRVFDITILGPNGEELNNFDPPVEICLRPTNAQLKKAGWNFANLVMFHRHAGGPWEPVYNTYEKDGKLCAKMWLLSEFAIGISQLPDTGFAPGINHVLPSQPAEKAYSTYDGFMLDIPSLGLNMPIVGVPLAEDGWDVQWLGRRAGWLHGTAFPTWAGNTAITAHVWDANNNPGPFIDLDKLQHGDEVILHAWGLDHTYEVREVELVRPDDLRALPHSEYDTLTLLTCQGYDEASSEYDWRLAVRAVLIDVEAE
jgi:LPXTG-site transpeptidase (sortase) family protein